MKLCGFKTKHGICCLPDLHDGIHVDKSGLKFIDDDWPNHLGNGPDGYPMNNQTFDKLVLKLKKKIGKNAAAAEEFLRKMSKK